MAKHAPPAFRLLSKPEGSEEMIEVGQAWTTAKKDCFSVSLDLEGTGEKIRVLMVTNRPAAKKAPAPDQRPAA